MLAGTRPSAPFAAVQGARLPSLVSMEGAAFPQDETLLGHSHSIVPGGFEVMS
jgi:hypothetical protein